MKVFVFGAGASKGSQISEYPPNLIAPLTNEFFTDKYYRYANEVGLSIIDIEEYRKELSKFVSFEEWMNYKWEKAQSIQNSTFRNAAFRKLAHISFYIWDLLLRISQSTYDNVGGGRDNNIYRQLMDSLYRKEEDFALINFNYDLLLDFAFKDVFKETLHTVEEYLQCNYIKPHGSVNWFLSRRESDQLINFTGKNEFDTKIRLDTAIKNMFNGNSLNFDGHIVFEPNDRNLYSIDDILIQFGRHYFYPLIFLPMTIKDYSLVSNFENKVINKAKDIISNASEIYLIGYRAKDMIIADLMKSLINKAKLHVINTKNSAQEIMNSSLKLSPNLEKGLVYDEGFANFMSRYN